LTENMQNSEFKYLIRVSRTDLDGNKKLIMALQDIYGVGEAMARAVIRVTKLDPNKLAGYLTEEEVKKIEGEFGEDENQSHDYGCSSQIAYRFTLTHSG